MLIFKVCTVIRKQKTTYSTIKYQDTLLYGKLELINRFAFQPFIVVWHSV